ncbi:MAG: hypothetical protein COV72_09335 [Candidatus Omnitrophica bacterium CG11_big_fil_rev_8_21_14_0_20_42_13]|uniref:CBS domain-containing protein n=1 Tax=Candidatus Ghiorseimicrobium undicola TaxID=1974746 RepID=A0A2H0LV71_9BACT|nr:MAG: hypothetical protein COV72_09335 [Candidatus Omnitrophica bacterium CG11_big_fil_rev_8_21_14_0_20_42_13]
MKIKEIMVRDIKSLSGRESVKDALNLILKFKISGLPVIDKGKLIGVFTEKDVLRAILPSYVNQVGGFVYGDTPKNIKNKLIKLAELKVSDVMAKGVEVVGEETALLEAARLMLVKNMRRIIVVDKNDKVLGIAARCDILRALMDLAK